MITLKYIIDLVPHSILSKVEQDNCKGGLREIIYANSRKEKRALRRRLRMAKRKNATIMKLGKHYYCIDW